MAPEEINKLFAETLLGDYDDDAPWAAIRTLHRNGNLFVFDQAAN